MPKAAEDENSPVHSVAKPSPRIKMERGNAIGKPAKKQRAGKRKKGRAI